MRNLTGAGRRESEDRERDEWNQAGWGRHLLGPGQDRAEDQAGLQDNAADGRQFQLLFTLRNLCDLLSK